MSTETLCIAEAVKGRRLSSYPLARLKKSAPQKLMWRPPQESN